MDIQDDFPGNPGSHPAYLRTSFPSVPAHIMEGFPFFGNVKAIDFSVPNLVDLRANAMANFLPKSIINPLGHPHRFPVLFLIFQLLPAYEAAHPHNGPRERAAGFSLPGHTPGEGASGLENLLASHLQLILQSCKNGLGSAEIFHVIPKGQFRDLIQQLFSIFHPFSS